jgi:hypothetical protein
MLSSSMDGMGDTHDRLSMENTSLKHGAEVRQAASDAFIPTQPKLLPTDSTLNRLEIRSDLANSCHKSRS